MVNEWSVDFFRSLVERNPDAILAIDEDGRVRFANPAAAELFARPISQLVNLPFGYPIADTEPQEVEIIQPEELPRIVEMRVVELTFQAKTYHIASLRDITKLALQRQELSILSLMDSLAGLYNRRGFLTLAGNQLKLAQRNEQCTTLFYLDLDGLKQINDRYGHSQGDQAILATAALLRQTFRETDIKARLGGDEFAVMAIDAKKNAAGKLLTRLENSIRTFNQSENQPFHLSLSIGTSLSVPIKPATIDELIEQADAEMYRRKALKKAGME